VEDVGNLLPGISFTPVGRPAGVARTRWRLVADSLLATFFFGTKSDVARAVEPECVAELRDHLRAVRNDFLSGVGARLFATGNDIGRCGPSLRVRATKTISARAGLRGDSSREADHNGHVGLHEGDWLDCFVRLACPLSCVRVLLRLPVTSEAARIAALVSI